METRRAAAALHTLVNNPPERGATVRVAPQNLEAEQALLGALFLNNAALDAVGEFLQPTHFFHAVHGRIYAAIQAIVARGEEANPVTLKIYFDQDGALTEIGGAEYLARLAGSAVNALNAPDYGRMILDVYRRRELVALGDEMAMLAADFRLDQGAAELIEQAEQRLGEIAKGEAKRAPSWATTLAVTVAKIETAYKHKGELQGVPSGMTDLDDLLGGFAPEDMIVIGGRPGMGKTALACEMMRNAAEAGHPVFYSSLEMAADQISLRMMGVETGFGTDRLRKGKIHEGDFERVIAAQEALNRLPLHVDGTPQMTVAGIRARARRYFSRFVGYKTPLVIIDHLQLVRAADHVQHFGETGQLTDVSMSIKAMAKQLGCPVVVLSQLSRKVEERVDKRPVMSDLRQSGSLEQDADVVLFCYREAYYLERSEPNRKSPKRVDWEADMDRCRFDFEAIVAKQRNGPVGTVTLRYEAETTAITNRGAEPRAAQAQQGNLLAAASGPTDSLPLSAYEPNP